MLKEDYKRFLDCFDSNYFVTDGIPQSTYLSKKYLGKNSDKVVELYNFKDTLKQKFDKHGLYILFQKHI